MRIERRAQDRAEIALGVLFGAVLVAGSAVAALWLRLGLPRPGCFLRDISGIPCPTCGSTRMLESLLAGDVAAAAAWNPLVFCGVVVLAFWSTLSLARLFFAIPSWRLTLSPRERVALQLLAIAAVATGWAYVIWRSP